MKARRTTVPVIRSERGDRDRFAPESRPAARQGGLRRWALTGRQGCKKG
jgi:hypothetical protein